jgi:hypothetical protein
MKKQYNTPYVNLHHVRTSDVIITSDPQLSDDPSDGGSQQIKRNSDWDEYE